MQIMEHSLAIVTDFLLNYRTETCELAISECSEWLSREFLNQQLQSSRNLLSAA